jgi:hypothetical protein
MANREFKSLSTNETGVVIESCFVSIDSDGYSVSATASVLHDMTAVFTTTGVYTVTLADPFISILGAHVSWMGASASSAKDVELGTITPGTTTSVVVRTVNTSGAPAAPGSGNGFFLTLFLKNSSVK